MMGSLRMSGSVDMRDILLYLSDPSVVLDDPRYHIVIACVHIARVFINLDIRAYTYLLYFLLCLGNILNCIILLNIIVVLFLSILFFIFDLIIVFPCLIAIPGGPSVHFITIFKSVNFGCRVAPSSVE